MGTFKTHVNIKECNYARALICIFGQYNSLSRVMPRSCTEEEKVKLGKVAARTDMSSFTSCYRVTTQMNLVLAELSHSQLNDTHASRAIIMEAMTRVVTMAAKAVQCK